LKNSFYENIQLIGKKRSIKLVYQCLNDAGHIALALFAELVSSGISVDLQNQD